MRLRPPISKRTETVFPYTTRFRSNRAWDRVRRARGRSGGRGGGESCAIAGPGWLPSRQRRGQVMAACGRWLPLIPFVIPANAGTQGWASLRAPWVRSEEHTSELPSLMRTSYAVFCLKKKNEKKYY